MASFELGKALSWARQHKASFPVFTNIDDLSLQAEQCGGNTNFNYKVFSTSRNEKDSDSAQPAVFIKHLKGYSKCFGESAPISIDRLNYEYFGMLEFRKYGQIVPECYFCDVENSYLALPFLEGYIRLQDCMYDSISDDILPVSVSKSVGATLGACQAATHRRLISSDAAASYAQKYPNTDHFEMWDKAFFPMCLSRLRDVSLYRQSSEVTAYGEEHYSFIQEFISDTRKISCTCTSSCDIIRAVEMVRDAYLSKKDVLMHGDLHACNIMVKTTKQRGRDLRSDIIAESLPSTPDVKLVDFEKFAYGPAGLDVGLFLGNYVNMLAAVPTTSGAYTRFEKEIRDFWDAFTDAFLSRVTGDRENSSDAMNMKDVTGELLSETLTDAVGFMSWWLFSLTANCPVDVLPLPDESDPAVEALISKRLQFDTARTRQRHVAAAVSLLQLYASGQPVEDVGTILKTVRSALS